MANCRDPSGMADALLRCLGGNSNWFTAAQEHADALAPSTVSTRLGSMEVVRFIESLNANFRRAAVSMLRRVRPDHRMVICAVDGHEAPYWNKPNRPLTASSLRTRRGFSVKMTAKNKKARACHLWLFAQLVWFHRGIKMSCPIHMELLAPTERLPALHLERVWDSLHRARIQPGALVFDRGYDGSPMLMRAQELGVPVIVRLRDILKRNRHFTHADGEATTVRRLIEEVVAKPAPVYEDRWRGGEKYSYKATGYDGTLGADSPPGQLVLQVGVNAYRDRKGMPHWTHRPNRTMAWWAPRGADPLVVRMLYRCRWTIEAFFEQLLDDPSRFRPKTIQSHAVSFAAQAYRVALAHCLRLMEAVAGNSRVGQRGLPATSKYYSRALTGQPAVVPDG